MPGCDPICRDTANKVIDYFVERKEKRNAALFSVLRFSGARISEVVGRILRRDFITESEELAGNFDLLMLKTARRKNDVFRVAVNCVLREAVECVREKDIEALKQRLEERFSCQEKKKAYRRRRVDIPQKYHEILIDWLELQKKKGKMKGQQPVFDIRRESVWRIAKKAYRDLGIIDGKYALHSWRGGLLEDVYDYAAALRQEGKIELDPFVVAMEAVGHTSVAVTQKYIKKQRGDHNQVIKKVVTE